MPINFISSGDSDETLSMLTKSDDIEIIMGSETDDIIEELCKSFLQKYQGGLEESIRGSNFDFGSVDYCIVTCAKNKSDQKGIIVCRLS